MEQEEQLGEEILEEEESFEPETVEEETEPTSEEVEQDSQPEEEPEPKTVPVDALVDERRKRQELERRLDEISQGVQSLQQGKPPSTLEEAYDRDPQGVMRDLNAEIKKLSEDDAYGHASQIELLRDKKDELRRREFTNLQKQLNQQTTAQKAASIVMREIPDFNKRSQELTRFAAEELGYTQEDFERTNFVNGESAAREILRVNRLYEKFHAKPEKKKGKPKPTQVEGAGKGVQKTEPSLQSLLEKARETGDWTEYFDAKGLLGED